MAYESLNIYEDNNMITIVSDSTHIASEPKGRIKVKPFGSTQGFSFLEFGTNDVIAQVKTFGGLLDKGGSPWGGTYFDALTAINAFLDCSCSSSGGGGGSGSDPVIQDNITEVAAANYNILATDYIIICKVNTILTLPGSPSLGQVYKIKGQNVSITINGSGGQTIDGLPSQNINGYSAVELRYISTNNWGVF